MLIVMEECSFYLFKSLSTVVFGYSEWPAILDSSAFRMQSCNCATEQDV